MQLTKPGILKSIFLVVVSLLLALDALEGASGGVLLCVVVLSAVVLV